MDEVITRVQGRKKIRRTGCDKTYAEETERDLAKWARILLRHRFDINL